MRVIGWIYPVGRIGFSISSGSKRTRTAFHLPWSVQVAPFATGTGFRDRGDTFSTLPRQLCTMASVPPGFSTEKTITPDSKCVGCEGIGETLSEEELNNYLSLVPEWSLNESHTELTKSFRTKNFATALDFLNRVGAIAEAEGHHPDMAIKSYNHIHLAMSTHSLGGLTTNDIIMAVKIDALPVQKRKEKTSTQ